MASAAARAGQGSMSWAGAAGMHALPARAFRRSLQPGRPVLHRARLTSNVGFKNCSYAFWVMPKERNICGRGVVRTPGARCRHPPEDATGPANCARPTCTPRIAPPRASLMVRHTPPGMRLLCFPGTGPMLWLKAQADAALAASRTSSAVMESYRS